MIAIHDLRTGPRRFPLSEFLAYVVQITGISLTSSCDLIRFGGFGASVTQIEAVLEMVLGFGHSLILPFGVFEMISNDASECIDELHCVVDGYRFGISDSSFIFFQSRDKRIEHEMATFFQETTVHEDYPDDFGVNNTRVD